MKEKLGIPYMGSKRKLASDILQKITQRHDGITFRNYTSVAFKHKKIFQFNTKLKGTKQSLN